jgi:hypothetical protein
MLYLAVSKFLNKFCPYSSALPAVESRMPVNMEIVLVLPAPLWPSSTKI